MSEAITESGGDTGSEADDDSSKASAKVIPGYHSAVNEIIEPDKILVMTRYFVRRWMPILGENGTRIVLALRSLGYYNRQTGEKRDGIEIDLPELAVLCGISLPTLKREFGERHDSNRKAIPGTRQNPALHRFVTKDRQYWRDPVTNRLLRTANLYRVMMDDPLHEDDLPRLREILEAREKGSETTPTSKAQSEPKPPRKRGSQLVSKAQSESPSDESDSKKTHFHQAANQSESLPNESEPTLIDDSSVPQFPLGTFRDAAAAPDFSASLFAGEEENPAGTKPARGAAPSLFSAPRWKDLPEAARRPYLDRAQQELVAIHAGSGVTPKPRLIEMRAQNLYLAAQNGAAQKED
jgi:hypothetical protein